MISTEIAATSACATSCVMPNHTAKLTTAMATTSGTNQAATASASAWIGARLRCADADQRDDLAEPGLGADRGRPHDESCRCH